MTALPPPGEKAVAVRRMFDRIAPRYDRMNRLLTGTMDQRWRRSLVRALRVGPGDVVLDLACGTGDLAQIAAARGARVVALDYATRMLRLAAAREMAGVELVRGDALHLPLADGSVTAVVSGFALRNFTDISAVLHEAARVLAPRGRLGLLEVDQPRNRILRAGHAFYFDRVVPFVGGLLSDRAAYTYLRDSTAYLPPEDDLLAMVRDAGFPRVRKRSHLGGAAQAILAVRA